MHRRQSVALLLSAFCLNGKEVNAQGVNKGAVKVGSQRKTQASKSACQEMRGERHQFTGAQLGGDGKAGQREFRMRGQEQNFIRRREPRVLACHKGQGELAVGKTRADDDGGAPFRGGQVCERKQGKDNIAARQRGKHQRIASPQVSS